MNTTVQSETELSSVNSILMAIGQAPITRIYQKTDGELIYINPEVALVHSLLMEAFPTNTTRGWYYSCT
jgi:hypothetical protein